MKGTLRFAIYGVVLALGMGIPAAPDAISAEPVPAVSESTVKRFIDALAPYRFDFSQNQPYSEPILHSPLEGYFRYAQFERDDKGPALILYGYKNLQQRLSDKGAFKAIPIKRIPVQVVSASSFTLSTRYEQTGGSTVSLNGVVSLANDLDAPLVEGTVTYHHVRYRKPGDRRDVIMQRGWGKPYLKKTEQQIFRMRRIGLADTTAPATVSEGGKALIP